MIRKYFIPFSRNYEAVDGLLFSEPGTLLLFQIIMAKKYKIKSCGIKQLLNVLLKAIKKVYIIFVVPEEREDKYVREQKILNMKDISPGRIQVGLKQFRLIFSDEKIQSVAIQSCFDMQEAEENHDGNDDDNGKDDLC